MRLEKLRQVDLNLLIIFAVRPTIAQLTGSLSPVPLAVSVLGSRCLLHSGGLRSEPHADRKLSAAEAIERKRTPTVLEFDDLLGGRWGSKNPLPNFGNCRGLRGRLFDANSHFSDDSLRADALGSMRPLQALAE